MKIVEGKNSSEKVVPLSDVAAGKVIRYARVSFADAMKENAFYMVVEDPSGANKEARVSLQPVDGKVRLSRDGDHQVVVHEVELSILSA